MSTNLSLQKSEQACDLLKELDMDAWLIWVRETKLMADPALALILGSDVVWQSALIYTKTGERIAIVGNYDAQGMEALDVFTKVVPYTQSIRDALSTELDHIKPKQIGLNYSRDDYAADGITYAMYNLLKEYLEGTPYSNRFISAEPLVTRLRGRKIPEEINRIQTAVNITEQIYSEARKFVQVDQTELEIYHFFHQRMQAHNVMVAWNTDHNPAVDAGPNKEFGHVGPTENRTKPGHLLHFDFGIRYQGYCSDLQRMFFLGSPRDIPEEVQTAFDAVRDAIQLAAKFIKPGVKGYETDDIARQYLQERGYEEYGHALGHQVGQEAHDGGTLLGPLWDRYGTSSKGFVEVGNVFTLEPHVRTKNYGQLSLEENIVITKNGCRFLSTPQTELFCIS